MRTFATPSTCALALAFAAAVMLVGAPVNAQPGIDPNWDHYRGYDIAPNPVIYMDVMLEDQFGIWQYHMLKLKRFSNPDKKTHGADVFPINNPRLHYTWWLLEPEPFDMPQVQVENQFGPQMLHVFGHEPYLLAPTVKNEPGPPPAANHYKCYPCQGAAPGAQVVLEDQFGSRTAVVGEPMWLCNPARKTIAGAQPYDMVDPDQHYVIYDIGPAFLTAQAFITDQFVEELAIEVTVNRFLHVPSLKFHPTPTRQSTWGRVKTLYR